MHKFFPHEHALGIDGTFLGVKSNFYPKSISDSFSTPRMPESAFEAQKFEECDFNPQKSAIEGPRCYGVTTLRVPPPANWEILTFFRPNKKF